MSTPSTALGIGLGSSRLRAATFPDDGPCLSRTAILTLDGAGRRPPECGTPAENQRASAGGIVLGGFVERVGDPVPLTAPDGSAHAAQALTAAAVKSLARATADRFTQAPPTVVAYPASWTSDQVEALREALSESALPGALRLESDLTCALGMVVGHPDVPSDGILAVVDMGASGSTVALVDPARVDQAGPTTLGDPLRIDEPSGTELDHALMRHVLSEVVDDPSALSSTDPNLTAAITDLRRRCTAAKEELSRSTVAVIDVDLPSHRGDVRVTRAELEDLLSPALTRLTGAVREATERAGRSVEDLSGIVAIGGGASIGLATQHLSGEFHRPVIVDADPATTAVRGAATIAGSMARARASRPAPPPGPTAGGNRVADRPRPAAHSAPPAAAAGVAGAAAAAAGAGAGWAAGPADNRSTPVTRDMEVSSAQQSPPAGPPSGPRPVLNFTKEPASAATTEPPKRRRTALIAAGAVALVLTIGGTAWALTGGDEPAQTPRTPTTSTVETPPEETVEQAPQEDAPVEQEAPVQVPDEPIVTHTEPTEVTPSETPPIDPSTGGTDGGGTDTGGTDPGTDPGTGGTDGGGTDAGGGGADGATAERAGAQPQSAGDE